MPVAPLPSAPCGSGTFTQSACGDSGNAQWFRESRGNARYRGTVTECVGGLSRNSLKVEFRLEVPARSNYDLYISRNLCSPAGSSKNGTGADEKVTISQTDTLAADDGFDFQIEVRYVSGTPCDNRRLFLEWSP